MIKRLRHTQTYSKTNEHTEQSVCPDGMSHQPGLMQVGAKSECLGGKILEVECEGKTKMSKDKE